jgi:hypothetical protein
VPVRLYRFSPHSSGGGHISPALAARPRGTVSAPGGRSQSDALGDRLDRPPRSCRGQSVSQARALCQNPQSRRHGAVAATTAVRSSLFNGQFSIYVRSHHRNRTRAIAVWRAAVGRGWPRNIKLCPPSGHRRTDGIGPRTTARGTSAGGMVAARTGSYCRILPRRRTSPAAAAAAGASASRMTSSVPRRRQLRRRRRRRRRRLCRRRRRRRRWRIGCCPEDQPRERWTPVGSFASGPSGQAANSQPGKSADKNGRKIRTRQVCCTPSIVTGAFGRGGGAGWVG